MTALPLTVVTARVVEATKHNGYPEHLVFPQTGRFDKHAQEAVEIPVRSGQFIFFTERCIHGSAANDSDRNRLAFNMRVIPTSVPAYTNKKYYRSVYQGGKYYLDKWGVCVLRGKDDYRLSRTIPAEALEKGEFIKVFHPAA